jgi:hypothetical protein
MAPMARRVTYGKQNWLIALLRLLESMVIPRLPMHRVSTVLEQIGARFFRESVNHFTALIT